MINVYNCIINFDNITNIEITDVILNTPTELLITWKIYYDNTSLELIVPYNVTGLEPGDYWVEFPITCDGQQSGAFSNRSGKKYVTLRDQINYNPITLGIENQTTNLYQLYPNPMKNQLHIDFKTKGDYQVTVIDVNGKQLIQQRFRQVHQADIKTASLPKGSYIIQIKTANAVVNQHMIK